VREPAGDAFSFETQYVINAAGNSSDEVAAMAGLDIDLHGYRLHRCKGEYFRINHPGKYAIKRLIYPPATAVSLGIHITPDMGQGLRLGPDARYVAGVDYTVDESQRDMFWESVRKFLPALERDELIADTAGIRPKLQGENEAFRDFVIQDESGKGLPGFIDLIGIESPGLTACCAIARRVKTLIR
jgi:L-2-hydroxyglutarate oxidase LhgO